MKNKFNLISYFKNKKKKRKKEKEKKKMKSKLPEFENETNFFLNKFLKLVYQLVPFLRLK